MTTKEFNTSKENQNLLEEIIHILMDIQIQTDFCVFYDFAGHVNQISIQIAKSKDNYEIKTSNRFSIYLTPYTKPEDEEYMEDVKEITDKLIEVKEKLNNFLKQYSKVEPTLEL